MQEVGKRFFFFFSCSGGPLCPEFLKCQWRLGMEGEIMLLLYSVYPLHNASDRWFFGILNEQICVQTHPFCQLKAVKDSCEVTAAFIQSTLWKGLCPAALAEPPRWGPWGRAWFHTAALWDFCSAPAWPGPCFFCGLQASVLFKTLVLGNKLFCLSATTTLCGRGAPLPQPGVQRGATFQEVLQGIKDANAKSTFLLRDLHAALPKLPSPHTGNLLEEEARPLFVVSLCVCMQDPSLCSHSPGERGHKSGAVTPASPSDSPALHKETGK